MHNAVVKYFIWITSISDENTTESVSQSISQKIEWYK